MEAEVAFQPAAPYVHPELTLPLLAKLPARPAQLEHTTRGTFFAAPPPPVSTAQLELTIPRPEAPLPLASPAQLEHTIRRLEATPPALVYPAQLDSSA